VEMRCGGGGGGVLGLQGATSVVVDEGQHTGMADVLVMSGGSIDFQSGACAHRTQPHRHSQPQRPLCTSSQHPCCCRSLCPGANTVPRRLVVTHSSLITRRVN
jgi:hypothetical protein